MIKLEASELMIRYPHLHWDWPVNSNWVWLRDCDRNSDRLLMNSNGYFSVSIADEAMSQTRATGPTTGPTTGPATADAQVKQATLLDRLLFGGECRGDQHQAYLERKRIADDFEHQMFTGKPRSLDMKSQRALELRGRPGVRLDVPGPSCLTSG